MLRLAASRACADPGDIAAAGPRWPNGDPPEPVRAGGCDPPTRNNTYAPLEHGVSGGHSANDQPYNRAHQLGNGDICIMRSANTTQVCAVSEILAAATLVFGFVLGWLLRAIFALAAISRAQERMQRKVRYWQSEAARARVAADHFRRLVAVGDPSSSPSGDATDPDAG